MGAIFQRADTRQEQLECVDIASVGDVELAVVLLERVDNGVELALLLPLILPVGIHRETEWVFPLVPVVNLDALELVLREHLVHGLVGRVPAQTAREQRVFSLRLSVLGRLPVRDVFMVLAFKGVVFVPVEDELVVRLIDVSG